MALNFPNSPTINQTYVDGENTWQWDGITWKSVATITENDPVFTASDVFSVTSTDISNWDTAYGWGDHSLEGYTFLNSFNTVTNSPSGNGSLSYNNVNGQFTFTPPNLSSYLTAESDTLADVLGRGNSTTLDITTTGKILYSNVYTDLGDLPAAATYHGMFAHVHNEGHGYFAHAGNWTQLIDTGSSIGELSDVDVTTSPPSAGQGLIWDNNLQVWKPGAGSSSGEFNVQITNSVHYKPLAYETNALSFPSTTGKRYVIESINVSNVATGDVPINIIVSVSNATEQTYIAYNVPIISGGAIELLKQPIVANPSDIIKVWATDELYVGINNAAEMYITYSTFDSEDYFGTYASTVTLPTTNLTTIHTSTTNPSVLQSIHLTNRTDSGDYPVSVVITSADGSESTYLIKDLILPRYSVVEILDRPKRIEAGSTIKVQLGQYETIDVVVSGKQILL